MKMYELFLNQIISIIYSDGVGNKHIINDNVTEYKLR